MAEKSTKKTKKVKPPAKPKAAEKKTAKKPEPKKAAEKKTAKKPKVTKAVEETEPEFQVIDHEYVPRHKLMAEDEVTALLERYGLERHHLPKILSNDPAIKQDELTRGDVVKIIRTSPTAGTAIYYRVVV